MWWLLVPASVLVAGAGFTLWVLYGIRLIQSGALELDDEGQDDD